MRELNFKLFDMFLVIKIYIKFYEREEILCIYIRERRFRIEKDSALKTNKSRSLCFHIFWREKNFRPHYPLLDLFAHLLLSTVFGPGKVDKVAQNDGGRRHFEGKKSHSSRSVTHGATRRGALRLCECKQRINSVCILI